MTLAAGTYRTACGCLIHHRIDASGRVYWELEEHDGTCRDIELAGTARPALLSDDPYWPSGPRHADVPLLEPD